ncbi:MAG: penicillin-binding protein activator LpoB [Spirochaetaceae bacterium]|nr:penicillin-binding protein activator LpoB [Spirochaetaceae bacterium]
MKNISLLAMIIAAAFILISCGPSVKVTRVAADEQIDLSGRWNDIDSQMVAREMISDVVNRPWINNFTSQNKRNPVVIVGEVRNRSSEHIEILVFTKSLERELINSGKVRFVASKDERVGVRDERLSQQTEASAETMKRLGQETGADFYLGGVITSVTDALDKQRVVFYKTNLELIHIETNEKVWIGVKEIKKVIEQKKNKR